MGSTRLLLCVSGVPTTSQQHRRGSGDRRPNLRAPRSPQAVGKGGGLLPRPVSGSQLVAERSSSLGSPELIVGNCVGPSSRSPSGNALPPQRCAASPGGQRSGESKDSRAGALAGNAAGGRLGGVPRARQAAAAPGKVLPAERGVAPRAGAAQVQLGRARASAKSPGAKREPGGREGGSPSGRGRGWGRRAERGWSNGEVQTGPQAKLRAARKSRGRTKP